MGLNVGGWVGGWVAGWLGGWLAVSVIILPLRGPSCKLRLARSSAKLNFSDGPSVAKCRHYQTQSRIREGLKVNMAKRLEQKHPVAGQTEPK